MWWWIFSYKSTNFLSFYSSNEPAIKSTNVISDCSTNKCSNRARRCKNSKPNQWKRWWICSYKSTNFLSFYSSNEPAIKSTNIISFYSSNEHSVGIAFDHS